MVWNDLVSLVPSYYWPKIHTLPKVGDKAPIPTSLVMSLIRLANENESLKIIIVCMAEEEDAKAWFTRIGGNELKNPSQLKLIYDISRTTYGELGIGYLPMSFLFSGPMWTQLFKLKELGIVNTETVRGSNRYQNSGGFAIDSNGIIQFVHVASHAGDMVDYEAAVKTIL